MQQQSVPFGFNIIGYASTNTGLGNTVRQYAYRILARNERVSILDIKAGADRSGLNNSLEEWFAPSANDLPYAVNLFVFGATDLPRFAISPPKGLNVDNRLNVFFVWWELTNLPQYLIDAAKVFDVLIAGSDFVHTILSNNVTGVPILRAPHPLSLPEDIEPNRNRFKLPKNNFIVFMGFDPFSTIERKNPFAAIEAFKLAFPDRTDCNLAIKVNYSGGGDKQLEANLKRLRAYAETDSRIYLIQESLAYKDLLCLYASCDAFISLHRSEGLGLVPLEAMRLGKPVVSTAWSGNMSYMNYSNACLVNFEFVPIEAHIPHYGSDILGINCHWAEPDVRHAAAWLRKLAVNPEFRLEIGLKAAKDAILYDEQACKANFVDELKAIWENREILSQKDKKPFIHQARKSDFKAKRRFEYKTLPLLPLIKMELDRYVLWRFHKNDQ